MRNKATVLKWGNSLAVRIPQAIAWRAGLQAGDSVAVSLDRDGAMVLRPALRRYELLELVSGITPENRHEEAGWDSD